MNQNNHSKTTCPLCQSPQNLEFEKVQSFGYPIVYYQCQQCGFVFQNAGESESADPKFYEETYRKIYQFSESPTEKDLKIQQKRAQGTLDFLIRQGVQKLEGVLDIGASSGLLLKTLRKAFTDNVVGVEPGRAYREFAQLDGLNMYASLEELEKEPQRKPFDLISLMHVLEHIPEPVKLLTNLRTNHLLPSGYLLIEVPNFYAHDSYELAHVSCFTPHSLRETLQKAGFTIVAMKKHGYPRSKLLNLYITVLAKVGVEEPGYKVKPEKLVRERRHLGFLYRRLVLKFLPKLAWLD